VPSGSSSSMGPPLVSSDRLPTARRSLPQPYETPVRLPRAENADRKGSWEWHDSPMNTPTPTQVQPAQREAFDAARTLGASRWRVFATVALPSAIPYFIAGMRTGVSTGFLALVAAELIAAPSGLGFMIQNAGQYFRTDVTIVGIIVIGILGAILDQIANRAGRRLTAWSDVRRDA